MTRHSKTFAEQVVQMRTGRNTEEHLRELYVERRYTDLEIAAVFGISRQLVQNWRRKYGIKRTDREAVA